MTLPTLVVLTQAVEDLQKRIKQLESEKRQNVLVGGIAQTSIANLLTKDHDLLDGLSDDDHTQYLLVNGSRDTTGWLYITDPAGSQPSVVLTNAGHVNTAGFQYDIASDVLTLIANNLSFATSLIPSNDAIYNMGSPTFRMATSYMNGLATGVRSTINSTTALITDFLILVNAGSLSDKTVTLPAASNVKGHILMIKRISSGTKNAIIAAAGSDTIEGAATVTLTVQYQSRTIISDGVSKWYILAST